MKREQVIGLTATAVERPPPSLTAWPPAKTANIFIHGIDPKRYSALLILLDTEGNCELSGSACLAVVEEPSLVIKQ